MYYIFTLDTGAKDGKCVCVWGGGGVGVGWGGGLLRVVEHQVLNKPCDLNLSAAHRVKYTLSA